MSDCRFGVSPVNYPDPDPDPVLNLNLCLCFTAMFVVISAPSASNIFWLLGPKHPDPLEIQPCFMKWRTKITINLKGEFASLRFLLVCHLIQDPSL